MPPPPPDPDDVPDMRLPERMDRDGDKPRWSNSRPPKQSDGYGINGQPGQSNWQAGDRVLAPWEPIFLYSGTIVKTTGDQALIDFDDGDSGWVFLNQINPLELEVGQEVLSRRKMGQLFFPGVIQEVNGENLRIEFDNGEGDDEHTTVAAIRIPVEARGRGAEQVSMKSHTAFLDHLDEGSRVWALWNFQAFFPGTVTSLRNREAHIRFDDGDQAWVSLEQLMPLDLVVGMFVMGRWKMGPNFFPGTITQVREGRVHIRYDDGDEEWTKPAALALPAQPPPGSINPTGNPGLEKSLAARNWIIGILVAVVAILVLWIMYKMR